MDIMEAGKIFLSIDDRPCRRSVKFAKRGPGRRRPAPPVAWVRRKVRIMRTEPRRCRVFGQKRRPLDTSRSFGTDAEGGRSGEEITPGFMAPRNTTQYLMRIAYQDLLRDLEETDNDPLPSWGLHASPDRGYESTLDFQERDFDVMLAAYADSP